MGRPPGNGAASFRFNPREVTEMEAILQAHNTQLPLPEVLISLSEKFSNSAERLGNPVQMKQVWNWFQNRRYALRVKAGAVRNMPQATKPSPAHMPTVQNANRNTSVDSQMEFEARSARDGAWYDVASFISYRSLETGELEVLVCFVGLAPDEEEWVNVRKNVRQRSLPCEPSECPAILPGDLILCFQEDKEHALYFDAHVLDAQRRRHDARGCRCRFLVRYDHDQCEEVVPIRKLCRRPETDYRLQQCHAMGDQQKTGADIQAVNSLRVHHPAEPAPKNRVKLEGQIMNLGPLAEETQTQHVAETAADSTMLVAPVSHTSVPISTAPNLMPPKTSATSHAKIS